jgi:acetyl esterase
VNFRQGMSEQLRQLLAEIGPRWHLDIRHHGDLVKSAYAPLLAAAPKAGVEVQWDLRYGLNSRHVLDLYVPEGASLPKRPAAKPPAPVIVFVHGGAFIRGEKSSSHGMYDNVMYWFARHGFVGVNLEYRLAPEAPFPGAVDDVASGLDWVAKEIASYGGDPSRVLLIGHSAGGTHVASYAFDPLLGYLGRHARAVVLLSARLRADRSPDNPNAAGVVAYFGESMSQYEVRSPMAYAACNDVPTFIVTAEFDNPMLDVYGLEFAHRIGLAHRRAPRYLSLRGHNHVSMLAHFNTPEEFLGLEILDFFAHACQSGVTSD